MIGKAVEQPIDPAQFAAVKALWQLSTPIALWVLGGFAICVILALFGGGPRPRFVRANLIVSVPLLFLPLLTEGWRGALVKHGRDAAILADRMAAMGTLLDVVAVAVAAMAVAGVLLRRAAPFHPEGSAASVWRHDGGAVLIMQAIALAVWWSLAQLVMPPP